MLHKRAVLTNVAKPCNLPARVRSPQSPSHTEKCRYRFCVLNLIAYDISFTAEDSAN